MLAIKLFYVSDRHVMVLVLPGCFLMAAGMLEAGHRLQRWLARPNPSAAAPASGERRAETPGRDWRASIAALPIAPLLLCVTVLICLPKTMQRVHGNRAGNHLAGLWLKERLRAGDIVVDDHCWSHFYSGQVFEEGKEPIVAPDYQPLCYVVMTRSKEREIDQRRRQEEERLRAASAHVVFHWPEGAEIGRARVVVYALPRDRQKQPWKIAAR